MKSKPAIALLLALGAGLGACSQEKGSSEVATAPKEAPAAEVSTPAVSITDEGNSSVVSSQDAEGIFINGSNSVQTRKVDGQDIQIAGDANQSTFMGKAKGLYVIGNTNVVTLENVASIQVTGDNNVVTWQGTATPTINNFGKNNRIAQAK